MSSHDRTDPAGLLGAAVPEPSDAQLQHLHDRLVASAVDDDLLDVAYQIVPSPFGPLLVAASDEGLVRVAFELEDHEQVLATLAAEIGPRVLETPVRTAAVATQLEEYFDGRRREFDVAVDLRLLHGFRREVVAQLPSIPYGSTASYGELAVHAGNPRAVRAVGSACSHNPIPVVLPCHRVVRSDGSIGQYLGGTAAKRALLALEAA